MSESRLRELLVELVADVDSPPMTQPAWRAAQRSRRRRRAGTMAVAVVLMVSVGVALADGRIAGHLTSPDPDGRSSVSPLANSTPAAAGPVVQIGPERAAVASLPPLATQFAALSGVPTSAPALSGDRVSRIVAAVQPINGPILVLGQDGRWRDADSGLGVAPDEYGNRGPSLTSTSISPDARRLVLRQTDGLLLIDATTGKSRLLPVPATVGRVDTVIWLPSGDRVAIAGDGGAALMSTTDGSYISTEIQVHELAVSRLGAPQVQLTASELVVQEAGTAVRRGYDTGDQVVLDEFPWYGAGWVYGSRATRTGFLRDGAQVVSVIDVASGRVTHLLDLPFGPVGQTATRSLGCCATLGWLDGQTVLLRDGGQIMAWRFGSGAVYRVARLPGTTTQGLDPGYDTTIALAQP